MFGSLAIPTQSFAGILSDACARVIRSSKPELTASIASSASECSTSKAQEFRRTRQRESSGCASPRNRGRVRQQLRKSISLAPRSLGKRLACAGVTDRKRRGPQHKVILFIRLKPYLRTCPFVVPLGLWRGTDETRAAQGAFLKELGDGLGDDPVRTGLWVELWVGLSGLIPLQAQKEMVGAVGFEPTTSTV